MSEKKLVAYGIASKTYPTKDAAAGDTYTDHQGRLLPTPLIFDANPYNETVKNAKVILDLGCGVGRNLPWIMENTDALYVGVDPNPTMRQFFWDCQDVKYKDRVTLVASFDELDPLLQFDVVVVTFVFQHVGYRPPEGQMNVTDITQEAMKYCTNDTVWILYEHDWEEKWLDRWFEDNDIIPQVYIRDFTGIPDLIHRSAHHLIIFKQR